MNLQINNLNRRWAARTLLQAAGVPLDEDFHALPGGTVEVILAIGQVVRFKKPENANGSYVREFYEFAHKGKVTLFDADAPTVHTQVRDALNKWREAGGASAIFSPTELEGWSPLDIRDLEEELVLTGNEHIQEVERVKRKRGRAGS